MIETLQDWNTSLGYCGCCPMPECPEPVMICSRKIGDAEPRYGYFPFAPPAGAPEDFFPTLYETRTELYSKIIYNGIQKELQRSGVAGGHSEEFYQETNFVNFVNAGETGGSSATLQWNVHDTVPTTTCNSSMIPQGIALSGAVDYTLVACPAAIITSTNLTYWVECREYREGSDFSAQGCPGPFLEAYSYYANVDAEFKRAYELSVPFSPADPVAEARAEMEAAEWSEPFIDDSGNCAPQLSLQWPKIGDYEYPAEASEIVDSYANLTAAFVAKVRVRFRIPSTHKGSKFWIYYDVGEFPEDGEPSFVSQDNAVEWTGPGTGEQSDPSWLTPWVEIDPPESNAIRHIGNIRYACYSGTKYGRKPQTMGAFLEIPPP